MLGKYFEWCNFLLSVAQYLNTFSISSSRGVFNKLDHNLLLAFILDYHQSLTILQDSLTFALTNQPRTKCKKIQLNNSFKLVLDEDVRHIFSCSRKSNRWRNEGYVQSVCNAFKWILNIQFGISGKAWSNIFTNLEIISLNFRKVQKADVRKNSLESFITTNDVVRLAPHYFFLLHHHVLS